MNLTAEETRDFHREIRGSDVPFEIKFYEGAKELIWRLKEAFDLVWVTSQWRYFPAWVPAREHLLEPFKRPVIFTHEKWRVQGDVICDDHPDNLLPGSWPVKLLMNAGPNKGQEYEGLRRVFTLDEILEWK